MADSADRGLIRRARLVFVARHRANATLRLEIDDGCVEAADLNPELSGKTLDARITSVGTSYLHLHVNHEEWDEFTFRLPLVLAFGAAERADPSQLYHVERDDATGGAHDSGAAGTGTGGGVAGTGRGDRAHRRRAGEDNAAADGAAAAAAGQEQGRGRGGGGRGGRGRGRSSGEGFNPTGVHQDEDDDQGLRTYILVDGRPNSSHGLSASPYGAKMPLQPLAIIERVNDSSLVAALLEKPLTGSAYIAEVRTLLEYHLRDVTGQVHPIIKRLRGIGSTSMKQVSTRIFATVFESTDTKEEINSLLEDSSRSIVCLIMQQPLNSENQEERSSQDDRVLLSKMLDYEAPPLQSEAADVHGVHGGREVPMREGRRNNLERRNSRNFT